MSSFARFLSNSMGVVNAEIRTIAQTKVEAMRAGSSVIVGAAVVLAGIALLLTALLLALAAPLGGAVASLITGAVACLLGAGVLLYSRRMRMGR